jgi:hypothetical protein
MRKLGWSRYLNFWVAVMLPTLGFVVPTALSFSQACSNKANERRAAMQRLVTAQAAVNTMLIKQARMESQIQGCIESGKDRGTCWTGDYDFNVGTALSAWSEFETALLHARPYAASANEVEAIRRLDSLFKYYRDDLARQVADEQHDARETAVRIQKTALELGGAVDVLNRV